MFAYCENNPVNKMDPKGYFAIAVLGEIALKEITKKIIVAAVSLIGGIIISKSSKSSLLSSGIKYISKAKARAKDVWAPVFDKEEMESIIAVAASNK